MIVKEGNLAISNTIMRKLTLLFAAFTALIFFACEDNAALDDAGAMDLSTNSEAASMLVENASYSATAEAAVTSTIEDVDLIIDEGIDQYFLGLKRGKIKRLDCADVSVDTATHILTIDFGEGCEDRNGVVRSGVITVEKNGRKNQPGSYHVVTFTEFTIDSVTIDGVRTSTNITDSTAADDMQVYKVVLSGGKLTFNDSITITRESELIRTKYRGDSIDEGYTTLTGNASGVLADGTTYTSTILEEIMMTRACEIHVPVSGVKDLVAGDLNIVVDYGDGTCDNLAELTVNGETITIELNPKNVCNGHGKEGKFGKGDMEGKGEKGGRGDKGGKGKGGQGGQGG